MRLGHLCFHSGLHAVLLYRLSRWLYLHHLGFAAVLTQYLNGVLTGAQISRRAVIGKGLHISHPRGLVVSGAAVIGDYCILIGDNLIGRLRDGNRGPKIGDYFEAGAGAKILGDVEIGNFVRVGPNSVVMRSLPDGVSVLGIPAKIIFRRGALRGTPDRRPHSREAISERLHGLLASIMDGATAGAAIDESTPLLGQGIGLDSLDVLNVVCAIEAEFDLTIDETEFTVAHFKTIGSLVTFIEERSAQQ
jgi:serine acetyltransferase